MRRASDIPSPRPPHPFTEETQMTQMNPILPEVRPERSAAKHWCRRHSKRSPRITAKQAFPTWHGSTAFRWHMSASACVPRPDAPEGIAAKHRMETAAHAAPQRHEHPADHFSGGLREHQLFSTACSTSGMVSAAEIPAGAHRSWPRQRIRYFSLKSWDRTSF